MAEEDLDTIRSKLVVQAAEILKIEPDKLDVNSPLISYGLDSLTFFNLTFDLEEKYGLNLIEDDISMDVSINDLVNAIEKKREKKSA